MAQLPDNIRSKILWRIQEQCLKLLDPEAPRGNAQIPYIKGDIVQHNGVRWVKTARIGDLTTITVLGKISHDISFPTDPTDNPENNDIFIFDADVDSGLVWKDTDGMSDIKAATERDIAQYNGTDWVKKGNLLKIKGVCEITTLTTESSPDFDAPSDSDPNTVIFNSDYEPIFPSDEADSISKGDIVQYNGERWINTAHLGDISGITILNAGEYNITNGDKLPPALNDIFIYSDDATDGTAVKGDVYQYDGTDWINESNLDTPDLDTLNNINDLGDISNGKELPIPEDNDPIENDIFIFSDTPTDDTIAVKGDVYQYDGTNWINRANLDDIGDITVLGNIDIGITLPEYIDPIENDIFIFSDNSTDDATVVEKGDVYQYDGTDWIKRGNLLKIKGVCEITTLTTESSPDFGALLPNTNTVIFKTEYANANNEVSSNLSVVEKDEMTVANEYEHWFSDPSIDSDGIRVVHPPSDMEKMILEPRIMRHVRTGAVELQSLIGERVDYLGNKLFDENNTRWLPAIIIEIGSDEFSLDSISDTSTTPSDSDLELMVIIIRLVVLAPPQSVIMSLPRPDQFDMSNPVRISHIRESLDYLLDASTFLGINDKRIGYRMPSRVKWAEISSTRNLEGIASPFEITDFRFHVKFEKQTMKGVYDIEEYKINIKQFEDQVQKQVQKQLEADTDELIDELIVDYVKYTTDELKRIRDAANLDIP